MGEAPRNRIDLIKKVNRTRNQSATNGKKKKNISITIEIIKGRKDKSELFRLKIRQSNHMVFKEDISKYPVNANISNCEHQKLNMLKIRI